MGSKESNKKNKNENLFISYLDVSLSFVDHRDHTKCCRESGIHEMCLPFCKGEMLDINGNTDLYQCVQHIGTALKCAEDGHSKSMPKIRRINSLPDSIEFFFAAEKFQVVCRSLVVECLTPDREPHRRHCVVVLEQDTFILA